MAKKVILEFKVEKDKEKLFMEFLNKNLANVRSFDGCSQVEVYYNPDKAKIIIDEMWESVEHHQKYLAFITNNGVMAELASFLFDTADLQHLEDLPPLAGQVSELVNPVDMYLTGKSPHTQRMTHSHMDRVARLFGYSSYLKAPWGSLRYIHVQKIVGYLQSEKYAPRTINATIAAIRGTAQAAFSMYQLDGDDLERIRGIKMVKGSRLPTGRMIPLGEISNLVNVCSKDEAASGPRDVAIIGCLYIAGLRRAEVVNLRREDLDLAKREIKVIGKGIDVFTVQRMAGHSDPQTTSGYDLRPEEDARAASEFLHLPYQRR